MRVKQIIFEKKALIVDGFMKKNDKRTVYNKCGSPEHPKLRVVLLPEITLALLEKHIAQNGLGAEDFVFTYNNRPVSLSMGKTNFILALIKAGIAYDRKTLVENGSMKGGHIHKTAKLIPDGRRIIPHSLRYTYVTLMSRHMDAKNLLKLTGHNSVQMVDYYNRTSLEMALASIPDAETSTNQLLPQSIGATV